MVSFVVFPLKQQFPTVLVMLYADDLMLFFEGDPSQDEIQGVHVLAEPG